MAITVNGAVLRNMPEQISKNVDDIADLQTASENYGTRITALENQAIALTTFQDCTFTGTTEVQGNLNQTSGNLAVTNNATIGGTLGVTGAATFASTLGVTGVVTASNDLDVGGDLSVAVDASVSGDLAVTGAATAQTFAQSQPNYEDNFTVTSAASYITLNGIYNKLMAVNGIAYLIISSKGEVNDGSSHSVSLLAYNQLSLPNEIGSKIIDINGNNVSEAIAQATPIAFIPCIVDVDGNYIDATLEINNAATAGYITAAIRARSSVSLTGTSVYTISARAFLTLF